MTDGVLTSTSPLSVVFSSRVKERDNKIAAAESAAASFAEKMKETGQAPDPEAVAQHSQMLIDLRAQQDHTTFLAVVLASQESTTTTEMFKKVEMIANNSDALKRTADTVRQSLLSMQARATQQPSS